jgi:predicted glycosyltransferase
MIPEFLNINRIKSQGAITDKIIKYPGLKEGVYLWNYNLKSYGRKKEKNAQEKKSIFIRPEPSTAQYYKGRKNFIDDLLLQLKRKFNIFLLPRNKVQVEHYTKEKFAGIKVLEESVKLIDILENCDLFIGAGGTMTRETAVFGIPTISIYQDSLLDVDKHLIEKGYMIHKKDLNANYVINFLIKKEKTRPDSMLLQKGQEAYKLILSTLLNNSF